MEQSKENVTSRMFKSSSIYALSGLLRNLVGFVMLPIYTRYLTPADYGIVALMVFVVSLIEITLGARMGHAPQKFYHDQENDSDKKKVIATALFTTSFFSLLVTAVAMTQSDLISSLLYKTKELGPVVSLFLILISTQAIEAIGLIFIRIQNRAALYFWLSLAKLIIQVSANIYCIVILELGVLGMATATAFSAVLFAGIVLLYVIRQTGIVFNKEIGIRMLLFSVPLWFSGLVSLYIGSSNRYLMNVYTTLEDIGLYSLAERLAAVVGVLIFSPFYNYWSAERFRLKDRPDFDEIHRNIFTGIYVILVLFGFGICLYGTFIIGILTEEKFHGAVDALPYLIVAYTFHSLSQFYQFSFLNSEKTGLMSRIMNITAVATTVLNFALIPFYGFVGAALACMFSYLVVLLVSRYYADPIYDMKLPLNRFFVTLAVAAAGFAVSQLFNIDPFTVLGFVLLGVWYLIIAFVILAINVSREQATVLWEKMRNRELTSD